MTVTLEGVRYVVDCGKHKTRDFNGTTGMESLTVKDISKAQVRSYPRIYVARGLRIHVFSGVFFSSLVATTHTLDLVS